MFADSELTSAGEVRLAERPASRHLGVSGVTMLFGSVFTLAVGLPLQIYVARVLGASGLGVFGLLEAAVGTVTGLCGFGLGQTAARFIPAHLDAKEFGAVRGLLRLGAAILLGIGVVLYAGVLLSLPSVASLWPAVAEHRAEIVLMALMIPLGLVLFFVQQALRGFQDARTIVAALSVGQLAAKAVLAIALLSIGYGLIGYIGACVAAAVIGGLWIGLKLYRDVKKLPRTEPSYSARPQWLRYALIVYTGSLVGMAGDGLDRYLSAFFLGSGAVGVLVVARQLQSFPERFNGILLTIGAPMLAGAHSRGDAAERQHLYTLITDWSVRLAIPLLFFLFLFARPVLMLFGPEFAQQGALPLQILLAGQLVSLLCGPAGNTAMMSGLEKPTVVIWAAQTSLLVALLVVLTWRYQLVGTAAAISISVVVLNAATLWLLRQRLNLRWWDNRFAMWLPQAAAIAACLLLVFELQQHWSALALIAVLAGSYGLALAVNLASGLQAEDRDLLRHLGARFAR